MIDDKGKARLATAGRSSVVAEHNVLTPGQTRSTSGEYVSNLRYSAPEIQWLEAYEVNKPPITKESDVYGMAMVIYEVRTYQLA